MKALFEACNDFLKGKLSKELILATLSEYDAATQKSEEGLRGLKMPDFTERDFSPEERAEADRYHTLGEDAMRLLRSGVEACQQGLHLLRTAVEQRNQRLMQEGAKTYQEGVQLAYQVQRLSVAVGEAVTKAEAAARMAGIVGESEADGPDDDYPSDMG
jgi:hypothetical protein